MDDEVGGTLGVGSPELAMAKQLRAWGFPAIHDASNVAIRSFGSALAEVSEFAGAGGLPLAESMEFGRVAFDYGQGWRQGWARGSAMVDFGPIMNGYKFMAPEQRGIDAAIDAGSMLLMARHPFLHKGWRVDPDWQADYVSSDAFEKIDAWMEKCHAKGGACGRFARLVEAEAIEGTMREAAKLELQVRLARCARAGLIPSAMESSELILTGGLDGAPTWIQSWRVDDPKGRASIMGKMATFDLMRPSSVIKREQRDAWEWALPALSSGIEAMWEHLCAQISKDLARGWSHEEFGDYMAHIQGHGAAMERIEIGEASARGSPSKRPGI